MNRRLGKFAISRRLIECEPGLVKQVMKECLILRAEMMYCYDNIEYIAQSDYFDIVEDGQEIPVYDIHFRGMKWMFFPKGQD